MGGPDMGGLILYGACNGGPGIVRNVPNPAHKSGNPGVICSLGFYFDELSNYTSPFNSFLLPL